MREDMVKRTCISIAAVVALGLLVAGPVAATTLELLDAEQMVEASQLIVVGKCTASQTRWVGRTLITFHSITVEDTILGAATTLEVAVPGGHSSDGPVPIAVLYPGAPHLAVGETFLLFLQDGAQGLEAYNIVGFSQGALPLTVVEGKSLVVGRSRKSALPLAAVKQGIRRILEKASSSR